MSVTPVPKMKTVVSEDHNGLAFTIPAKRMWFALFFVPIWLIGWLTGEIFAIRQLFVGGEFSLFLLAWLAMWTVGGVMALALWIWLIGGRERVFVSSDRLTHRHEVFGIGISRHYDLSHVRDLRVSQETITPTSRGAGLRWWGIGGGVVAFDYGATTVRFAASVDEAEGKMITRMIEERYSLAETAS